VENTNPKRYLFIEKCVSNPELNFEGGLVATYDNQEYNKYKDFVITKAYSVSDYLFNTKQSILTFNTPAVFDCHGWKLGEFMAMGKAIISTSLTNDLPKTLQNGVHLCIADTDTEIADGIEKIRTDDEFRHKLETNIKHYFNEIASPRAVINFIIHENNEIDRNGGIMYC